MLDLDGYCRARKPEVFAYRPAPLQVSWLAYPGTTGADFMDYVIADRFVLPESLQPHFSEKVAYLPRCYQSTDPTRAVGIPPHAKLVVYRNKALSMPVSMPVTSLIHAALHA